MTFQAGTRLGPYEIVTPLRAGGMGEVWRAKDTRLDREVAIKVLPPGLAQNEHFLQRFDREAKVISQLNHPHVCTLYDVGQAATGDEPLHYLVMELLEGESLADRINKGPLPIPEVLKVGVQIASAAVLDGDSRRTGRPRAAHGRPELAVAETPATRYSKISSTGKLQPGRAAAASASSPRR